MSYPINGYRIPKLIHIYFPFQKQAKNIQDEDKYDKPVKQKQIVQEDKLEDEWDSLPAWKKEIMMKRGGAIKNWGDEREEVNEED